MIRELRARRAALVDWIRSRVVNTDEPQLPFFTIDEDELEQMDFISDPPGDPPVPQVFREFVYQRARRAGVQFRRMANLLGYRTHLDMADWQQFLNRPLALTGYAHTAQLVELSVILEVDVEILLELALKQESLHRESEIREAVHQGTLLTGPSAVRIVDKKAAVTDSTIPELPRRLK